MGGVVAGDVSGIMAGGCDGLPCVGPQWSGLSGGTYVVCQRLRVVSWLVGDRRVRRCGSWCAGPGQGRPGGEVSPAGVCVGSKPG